MDDTAMAPTPPDAAQWQALMDRAARGDVGAWAEMQQYLKDRPQWWAAYGDLGRRAAEAWLLLAGGDDLPLRKSIEAQWNALKQELSRPHTAPVERLLVERVGACWLQVHYAEIIYASYRGKNTPLAVLTAAEQRLDRAHKRYLAALRQLTTLQRLLPPAPVSDSSPAGMSAPARRKRRTVTPRKGSLSRIFAERSQSNAMN